MKVPDFRKNGLPKFCVVLAAAVSLMISGCSRAPEERRETSVPETAESRYASFDEDMTIICSWASGGSSDVNARRLAQIVSEKIGQVVMVDNITGNGGAAGFTAQADSPADGNTLGMVTAELNTLIALGKVDYQLSDFYPLIRMNTIPACVAVPADSPFQTLQELLDYATEHPEALKTGDVGAGSIWHICANRLEKAADVAFTHVSFEGAAPAAAALVEGNLDLVTVEPSVIEPYVKENKARILAVMSEERLSAFSEYPTCIELGYDIVAGSFHGIVCPAGVPEEKRRELESLLTEAFESEEYQKFCEEYGLERSFLDSAEFATFLEEDLERVKENLSEMGLQ